MKEQLNHERLAYVDWLRILAVLLLIPFHTSQIFTNWIFYVKHQETSNILIFSSSFIHNFHMPLFIFLAGISSFYALQFKSEKLFIIERFKRLFVPLIFGVIAIIPPQSYIRFFGDPARVWPKGFVNNAQGVGYSENFFQFYPKFYNGIFPNGNLEWGHLWFLAYLLTFSLIAIPVFIYLKSDKAHSLINKCVSLVKKPWGIFLFFIPIALFEIFFRWKFPGLQNLIADWANFFTYITIFIYGYLIMTRIDFLEAIDKYWKQAFILAGLLSVFTALNYTLGFIKIKSTMIYITAMILRGFITWCWMIAFLGLGRKFLTRDNKILNYTKEAALPYYILHQSVIIIIGYYILKLNLSIAASFALICFLSFFIIFIIYEIIIRRLNIFRFLFGMKTKNNC